MKRLLLIFAFCLLFAGCGKQNTHDNTVVIDMTSEGLFLPCADGNYMAIFDNYGPVELHTGNDDYSIFDDLTVGDRVRVNHGILLETYPASTEITGIEKLADGSREDIPEDVIASLEELGRKIWPDEVPEEKQGKSTLSYLYPYSEEEMPIEFFEPNGDGTLPFDYDYETGVCVIHDSEDIIFTLDDPWMEKAIKVSEGMYLFSNCCGHGTGCQMEELYRLQAPDYVPVKVLSYESIVDALNSRINYKYDEKYDVILFEWGEDQMKRKNILLSSYLKEHESEFEAFGWGDIVRIEFYEGRPWIYALGSMVTKPYLSWFDYTAGVTAPISLDDYSIGDVNLFVVDNSVTSHHDDIKKSLEDEIPFFYCYCDINHNGCKDKIILSAEIIQGEYSGSFDDVMQKSMEASISNARVFDGSYIYTDPGQQRFNDFASLIYEFSAAHAGNGQLFVTTVNGADYLVETSLWSGQGESSYRYKVFFGDWQSEFVVEEKYVSFEYGNPPENINEFWDGLYKWINDSSVLLIAADIDSDPMVTYSTIDNILSPKAFYDKKRGEVPQVHFSVYPTKGEISESIYDCITGNKSFQYIVLQHDKDLRESEYIKLEQRISDLTYALPFLADGESPRRLDAEFREYAITDLDGDGSNELIYYVYPGGDGYFLIFHETKDTVNVYPINYRSIVRVTSDGYIEASYGASNGIVYKITAFFDAGYQTEEIAEFDENKYTIMGEDVFAKENKYTIMGENVSAEEMWEFFRQLDEKEEINWIGR